MNEKKVGLLMSTYNTITNEGSVIPTLIEMCKRTPKLQALYIAHSVKCLFTVQDEMYEYLSNAKDCKTYSQRALYFSNGSKLQCILQNGRREQYQNLKFSTIGYNIKLDHKQRVWAQALLRGALSPTVLIEKLDRDGPSMLGDN